MAGANSANFANFLEISPEKFAKFAELAPRVKFEWRSDAGEPPVSITRDLNGPQLLTTLAQGTNIQPIRIAGAST